MAKKQVQPVRWMITGLVVGIISVQDSTPLSWWGRIGGSGRSVLTCRVLRRAGRLRRQRRRESSPANHSTSHVQLVIATPYAP